MSQTLICDWCAEEIDHEEEFDPAELDRLGLEDEIEDGRYVVVESRFGGRDRWGHAHTRRVVRHFHSPRCYQAALRLLADHRRWAEAQAEGRTGAETPRWRDESLKGGAVRAPVAPMPAVERPDAPDLADMQRRARAGTPLETADVCHRARNALRLEGVACLEELVDYAEIDVLALEGVGHGTIEKLRLALDGLGLSFRTGIVSPVEFGRRLRRLREVTGITTSDLERELKSTGQGEYGCLTQWQSGRAAPTPQQRAWLADRLGVHTEDLMLDDQVGAGS
jgi:hypothetical protein